MKIDLAQANSIALRQSFTTRISMDHHVRVCIALFCLLVAASPAAEAQLSPLSIHGDPMIQDASTSLVWADTPSPGDLFGGPPVAGSGAAAGSASTWAMSLDSFKNSDGTIGYGGYTDWHLPTISQMIHLYVTELGNVSGTTTQYGPFTHLNPVLGVYWSITLGPNNGEVYLWSARSSSVSYDFVDVDTGEPQGAMAVRGVQTAVAPTCVGQTSGTGTFSVTKIPPAGTYPTIPPIGRALNACGEVTGEFYPVGFTIEPHLFLYKNKVTEDLTYDNAVGCSTSGAIGYGINSSEVIAGTFCGSSESLGIFTWNDGFFISLFPGNFVPPAYSVAASAINTNGLVAGTFEFPSADGSCPGNYYHPFFYDSGSPDTSVVDFYSAIHAIGGCSGQGLAINDSGQVVGFFSDKTSGPYAYIYSAGTVTDLGNLGYQGVIANGINASGQVTGYASTCCGNGPDAFLYTAGNASIGVKCFASTPVSPSTTAEICDLGNLGGASGSQGNGINASGQIVGTSFTGAGVQHAFLFSDGRMQDLNSLIPSSDAALYTLVNGVAINDYGQVLVTGHASANPTQTISLLLTPPTVTSLPGLSISPTSVKFPSVGAGSSSASQTISLKNTGTSTITLTNITLAGGQTDDYVLTKTCGSSLAAGASCTLSVIFKPVSAGAKSASISIVDNASGSPQSIALTGTGTAAGTMPVVKLSATSLTFASQAVGTTSPTQTVTLTNSGTAPLSLASVGLTGGQADDYVLANGCGAALVPGASCTLSIDFKPVSAGTKLATVSIADDATGSPQLVALTGTGAAAGTSPAVTLSPVSLTFASQAPGSSSAPQAVTLTNSGKASLSLVSVGLTGGQADDYVLSKTCGASLVAGASCTLSVTFKPVSSGKKLAAITITDSASGSPQAVPLSGTGT